MSAVSCVLVLIWSGFCAADQRVLAGRQIHQPIVAAVVAGLLLGEPERGLLIGVWMQLVWSVPLPVGGTLLPDTGSSAVAATLLAVLLPGPVGISLAILFGLLLARGSIPWERRLRSMNALREEALRSNDRTGLSSALATDFLRTFLRGVSFTAAALLLGISLAGLLDRTSSNLIRYEESLQEALLGGAIIIGYAGILRRFRTEVGRGAVGWIGGGFLLGVAVRWILQAGS